MKIYKYAVAMVGLGFAVSAAQAQNVVQNGSFGTGSLADWIVSGNVGVSSGEGVAPGDTFAVVFNGGNGPTSGVISQSFATTPGAHYTLTFDYGTYGMPGVAGQTLDVEVSGNSTLVNTSAISLPGGLSVPFELFTYSFTADSTSTDLRFADAAGNNTMNNDGILDSVSVVDPPGVPDSGSTAMLCGMSLVALGWIRRKLA
jgi:hypothetical protein